MYDTGEGKFFVNDEEKGGQKSDKPKDCKMSDCLDFELSLEDVSCLEILIDSLFNTGIVFYCPLVTVLYYTYYLSSRSSFNLA